MTLPRLTATRYVIPLREGGSLPAVLDTDEDGMYVAKFRGAGQGARVLVAEIIAGSLARTLELPIPDIALIELDEAFGRTERDPEIQDILKGSRGLNVGLRYLEGAFNYDPVAVPELVEPDLAARIVWFDAFITNVDRTPRNPNIMVWQGEPWLIDHGASLYFHHDWASFDVGRARSPFGPIKDHILLGQASPITDANEEATALLTAEAISAAVEAVPAELLLATVGGKEPVFPTADEFRDRYLGFLTERRACAEVLARHAEEARVEATSAPRARLDYRR
jgi:hypothetical protein